MARTVSTTIARNGREITITRLRDDGTAREARETIAESADEWRACAEGAARDALAVAMTRENAARSGARVGRKVARDYLGTLDTAALLAGVLAG